MRQNSIGKEKVAPMSQQQAEMKFNSVPGCKLLAPHKLQLKKTLITTLAVEDVRALAYIG